MTAVQTPVETVSYVTASAVSSPAAETAFLTSDPLSASVPPPATFVQRPVTIRAQTNITAGTGTTAVVIRCRQGSGTGGTLIGVARTQTIAAAATEEMMSVFRDTSPLAGSSPYTITVAQTGNTVAGTVNAIDVEVTQ